MGRVIRIQVMGSTIARLAAEAFLAATPGLCPVEQEGEVVWVLGLSGMSRLEECGDRVSADRRHWLLVIAEDAVEVAAARATGVRVIVGENELEPVLRQAIEAAASGRAFTSPRLAALAEVGDGPGTRRRSGDGAAGLSRRELDVALLRAQGLERAEIATALSVSENTVKTHLQHIHRKLGVQDRAGLARALAGWSVQTVTERDPHG